MNPEQRDSILQTIPSLQLSKTNNPPKKNHSILVQWLICSILCSWHLTKYEKYSRDVAIICLTLCNVEITYYFCSTGALPVIVKWIIYQAEILKYYHQSTMKSQGLGNRRGVVKGKEPDFQPLELVLGLSSWWEMASMALISLSTFSSMANLEGCGKRIR